MIWVDYAILIIIAVSAVIGLFRGLLREAIGLASWLLAALLAFRFCTPASQLLAHWISAQSIRVGAAFAIIFIAVLIIGAIVNLVVGKLVRQTGFAGTDRALGGLFGICRGLVILIVLVLMAGMTSVPRDNWWQQSVFVGHLQSGAVKVRGWLPDDLARRIHYPPDAPAQAQQPKTPDPVTT